MTLHPAHKMEFDQLYTGLMTAVDNQLVYRKLSPDRKLELYTYTQECVFNKAWDEYTKVARGLIIDPQNKKIVATPFDKFFNFGEMDHSIPLGETFEVFEKMDGSLIIAYFYDNEWHCATKGSFVSEQAQWAKTWLNKHASIENMLPEATYLFEAIYPENRIVVKYPEAKLVLLSVFENGKELTRAQLIHESIAINVDVVPEYEPTSLDELADRAKELPSTHEGWVIRFHNGHRIKIKGAEYLRIHRMISNLTPLNIWELMLAGEGLAKYKQQLPEEFWGDFDNIARLLREKEYSLIISIEEFIFNTEHMSNKEIGLSKDIPQELKKFIFEKRRVGTFLSNPSRSRTTFYEMFRPTGNYLEGYVPSSTTINSQKELISG